MYQNPLLLGRRLCFLIALFFISSVSTANDNWPTWRGPLANGIAATAKPPLTWSETSNIKWKVKIPGLGSASPVIWENRVFIQTAIPVGTSDVHQFVIQCLDRSSGKLQWQQVAREEKPHEGHHADGTFASASSLTDGKLVFAYFGSRGLYCYDMDGKLQWSQDFGDMTIKLGFGEASSPALHGDRIIINWDHEGGSFIIALDKTTGKTLWKMPRDEATSWSTPLIIEHQGQPQVIVNATNKIRAYDLATGKVLWECAGLTRNSIPMPVAGDGMVYCTSGFSGNALLAIRLGGSGDLTGTDSIVWKHNKSTPYVPSPLLLDERLYFFAGNTPILSSFNAKTGKPIIDARRIEGLDSVYASPVGAAGRIYIVGRGGTTVVLKQSDSLEVLATNKLDDKIDASPAAVGTELFLRGREYLYCIGEK